ncbi:MAG: molybdate ABC transporter substrate-binding protein [Desulfovibrio sp.]
MFKIKRIILAMLFICTCANPAHSRALSIACAANFTKPMSELAHIYSEQNGISVRTTFGSTGMLYGQIINGAPYDLFFSADEKRPHLLEEKGLAEGVQPYATGRLALWTKAKYPASITHWEEAIRYKPDAKIGIANAKTAPYGAASRKLLDSKKLWNELQQRFAFGKSIGVTFQYAYSGSVDVAFIALSQALSDKGKEGKYWAIPNGPLIKQAACALKTQNREAANSFLHWLKTPEAAKVIEKYGYN